MRKISLIVPVFNEEDAIPIFYEKIRNYEGLKFYDVEIVFVNDGSHDRTEEIIIQLSKQDMLVKAISFTRNFGKESALCAGLDFSTGDAVIPMDVDLQDPIEVIPLLLDKWRLGADVVLAKRIDRSSDSYLKRKTAEWFYRIHNSISTPKIEPNVGDFRLLDRSIVCQLENLQEKNLFMKGLLSWVGGDNIEIVEYVRPKRKVGQTKFNGWKLWNLALEGITSFSTVPLRIWTYVGGGYVYTIFLFCAIFCMPKVVFWQSCSGLSLIDGYNPFSWWNSVSWHWSARRVYRSNSYRGEKSTALPC